MRLGLRGIVVFARKILCRPVQRGRPLRNHRRGTRIQYNLGTLPGGPRKSGSEMEATFEVESDV